jgi:hypothetical protein
MPGPVSGSSHDADLRSYLHKVGIQLNGFRRISDTIAISLELYLRLSAIAIEGRICVVLLDGPGVEVDSRGPVVSLEGGIALVFQSRCGCAVVLRNHDVDEMGETGVRAGMQREEKLSDKRMLSCYHVHGDLY